MMLQSCWLCSNELRMVKPADGLLGSSLVLKDCAGATTGATVRRRLHLEVSVCHQLLSFRIHMPQSDPAAPDAMRAGSRARPGGAVAGAADARTTRNSATAAAGGDLALRWRTVQKMVRNSFLQPLHWRL